MEYRKGPSFFFFEETRTLGMQKLADKIHHNELATPASIDLPPSPHTNLLRWYGGWLDELGELNAALY
jgi:hypothetical protein